MGRGVITKTHYEKEASETSVSIEVVKPYSWEPDDTSKNINNLNLILLIALLTIEFQKLPKKREPQ